MTKNYSFFTIWAGILLVYLGIKLSFSATDFLVLAEEEEEVRKAAIHNVQEGSVEFNNIKITGLKAAADSFGQAAAYSAGVAGIIKLLKSSSLPLTSKIALTLGVGTGSLATFTLTRTSLRILDSAGNKEIAAEVSNITVKTVDKNDPYGSASSAWESSEQLLAEHVNTLLILQVIIAYLLIQLLLFFILKEISLRNYSLAALNSWPQLQSWLLKGLALWKTTSNLWIYLLLVFLISFSLASVLGVYATQQALLANLVPCLIYPNAEQDKAKILSRNKYKSGIYRWTNLKNGKAYIGSSLSLAQRLRAYFSPQALKSSDLVINRALLKHGWANFSLEILEYCNCDQLATREQYYLKKYQPEYNILK